MKPSWTETSNLQLPDGAFAPMQQHPTYGAACTSLGSAMRSFVLRDQNGQLLGAAQVLVRPVPFLGTAALLSRGPVWAEFVPSTRRQSGLLDLLSLLKRDHRIVTATPEACNGVDPLDESGWLKTVTPCHVARLELGTDVEAMRARQHGKWRNRLVRAESAGLRVQHTPMPDNPGHWLLMKEAEQACARRYRRLPPSFTAAWVQHGGAHSARLFMAEHEGEAVAAMLFLLHGRCASYHVGWSGAKGRKLGAHNLLLWKAQLWLAEQGLSRVDLDLIDTHNAPGIARFKLGSGAEVVALGATRLSAPGARFFAERPKQKRARVPIRQEARL